MKNIELNATELNYLSVLFQCVSAATDPSMIRTKSVVFVDRKIVDDLNQLYLTLARIGTIEKLLVR